MSFSLISSEDSVLDPEFSRAILEEEAKGEALPAFLVEEKEVARSRPRPRPDPLKKLVLVEIPHEERRVIETQRADRSAIKLPVDAHLRGTDRWIRIVDIDFIEGDPVTRKFARPNVYFYELNDVTETDDNDELRVFCNNLNQFVKKVFERRRSAWTSLVMYPKEDGRGTYSRKDILKMARRSQRLPKTITLGKARKSKGGHGFRHSSRWTTEVHDRIVLRTHLDKPDDERSDCDRVFLWDIRSSVYPE